MSMAQAVAMKAYTTSILHFQTISFSGPHSVVKKQNEQKYFLRSSLECSFVRFLAVTECERMGLHVLFATFCSLPTPSRSLSAVGGR